MKGVFRQHFKPNTKMKNLLKVSALAFVFAAALTSCESKPAATETETTTTETGTMSGDAMSSDSAGAMSADSSAMSAPAGGASTTTPEQK